VGARGGGGFDRLTAAARKVYVWQQRVAFDAHTGKEAIMSVPGSYA
jgi:hypothetical protein